MLQSVFDACLYVCTVRATTLTFTQARRENSTPNDSSLTTSASTSNSSALSPAQRAQRLHRAREAAERENLRRELEQCSSSPVDRWLHPMEEVSLPSFSSLPCRTLFGCSVKMSLRRVHPLVRITLTIVFWYISYFWNTYPSLTPP